MQKTMLFLLDIGDILELALWKMYVFFEMTPQAQLSCMHCKSQTLEHEFSCTNSMHVHPYMCVCIEREWNIIEYNICLLSY